MIVAALATAMMAGAAANPVVNPGFEDGWTGWNDGDPSGEGTAISEEAYGGSRSVKLKENGSFVSQSIAVEPGKTYRLSAWLRGAGSIGAKVGDNMYFEQQPKKSNKWREIAVTFSSRLQESVTIFASCGGVEVRYDDFLLQAIDAQGMPESARILSSRSGGYGLSPDLPPGRNFDLLGWYLNTPADEDGSGTSDRFSEVELARGATDDRYFWTADDGGMVFRATVGGAKTSKNTRFTRTELRQMLRRGDTSIRTRTDDKTPNKNNWVFSSAPEEARRAAGAVDGTLRATLAVNHVTTTGDPGQIGRVIVGQIHAAVDEPIRLYYRKLPGNERGSVYAAHEISDGDDVYFELLGSRSNSAPDPADGIALDEKFSYEIDARGNELLVRLFTDGTLRAEQVIDMTDSGYDVAAEYMYFKAGVYNQNSTGNPDDFVQATFYELEAEHGG